MRTPAAPRLWLSSLGRRLKSVRLARLRATIAVLALTGLAVYAAVSSVVDRHRIPCHNAGTLVGYYRERFAPLKPLLGKDDVVGFVTDDMARASYAYCLSRYVLSPARVVYDTPCELSVGDFYQPATTNDVIERAGFEVVRDCGNGVRLIRRKTPFAPTPRRGP